MAEITYKGLYNVPSDYECADGQLATSLNLVPENGSLQPIFPPSLIFTLPKGYKVAYIHKTTAFTHYIITRADDTVNNYRQKYDDDGNPMYDDDGNPILEDEISPDIYYLGKDDIPESKRVTLDDLTEFSAIDGTEIVTIEAVGNTLIVATKEAINYYLWKVSEDESSTSPTFVTDYLYLGTHLPEIDISFGLQGTGIVKINQNYHLESSSGTDWYYEFEAELVDKIPYEDRFNDLSDDNIAAVTESVLAHVNKFVADYGNNQGKFLFPFFVRWAYRLYDQSLTMHSAPVLMVCTTGSQPLVCIIGWHTENDDITAVRCTLAGVQHALDYIVNNTDGGVSQLDNWKDIITSVDVFISAPLYTYDQSGEVKRFIETPNEYCLCRPIKVEVHRTQKDTNENEVFEAENFSLENYVRWPLVQVYEEDMWWDYETREYPAACVELPQKTEESMLNDIKDCSNFYLLKSIPIDELATKERTVIDIAEDYLQSLVSREVMTDDYDSHDALVPQFAYNYNNRLNLANIEKKLFNGYYSPSMFCHTNGYEWIINNVATSVGEAEDVRVFFYIRQDNKIIITRGGAGYLATVRERSAAPNTDIGGSGMFLYLYYPNVNAYKAVVYSANWSIEVPLTPHDFLNGAFYFSGWENAEVGNHVNISATNDQTVSVANKLYLSEINNPFFFPVEQIVTVGTGTILGIATAAKPLSQGQFGSFPLYAFCDDGVWALSVNNEGIYSAVQPITRDVCINEKAITQLDSSVLFPTDRGIMQISGNAATCITDVLNGDNAYDITQLPHYEQLLRLAGITDEIAIKPIREFLKTGVMLYDYTNQRIYVCSDDYNFAYVISCKSQEWGMAVIDISSVVNSYPDAYAMTSAGDFVNFAEPDKDGAQNTLLISRPIKLDGVNTLKTATSMLQRGYFDKRHIQCALWGSRDLMHWHTIRTSQSHELRAFAGTPYKYFRIAVLAQLTYGESIFGATLQATPRLTNKAR